MDPGSAVAAPRMATRQTAQTPQGVRPPPSQQDGAEYVEGAVVELLCEDDITTPGYTRDPAGLWRTGTITQREACNTAQERRTGKASRSTSSELSGLKEVWALRVCQEGEPGDWHVLSWQPPPGESRTNEAIPQGLWHSHVKLVQKSVQRGGRRREVGPTGLAGSAAAATPNMRTPLDIGRLPGGMSDGERGTCRAMQALAGASLGHAVDEGGPSSFAGRYHEGFGGPERNCTGNPSHDSLLRQLPEKEVTQQIFKAAGVPPGDYRSPKLCEAMHCAADILSVDLAYWGRTVKRDGADEQAGDAADLAKMLGCSQANDPVAAFRAVPSEALKVFLLTLCSVQYVHDTPGKPKRSAFDTGRTIKNLQDHKKLAKRCLRLLTIISQLAKATQSKGGLVALQPHQLHFALVMILDNGGLKDDSINRLSDHGVCDSADAARVAIKVASGMIDAGILKTDGPDHVAHLYAADNADIHKYGVEHNFVAVCVILLGWTLTEDDKDEMTRGLESMPKPSMDHCPAMAMSGADDSAIKRMTTHPVNILALRTAAAVPLANIDIDNGSAADSAGAVPAPMDTDEVAVDCAVEFVTFGILRRGTVTAVDDGGMCTIAVRSDDGDSTGYTVSAANVQVVASESSTAGGVQTRETHRAASPRLFPGPPEPSSEEHTFGASLTLTVDVLTSVSSKHKEATWEVLQSISRCSKSLNDQWQAVTTDFEFYIHIALAFFIVGLYIVPIIAFGHLAKCAAASMFTYYEKFFVLPLFAAMGLKMDSPKLNKYMKCTHISESLKALNKMQLALRIALCAEFLEEVGHKTLPGHPCTIRLMAAELRLERGATATEQLVLDSNGRPVDLTYGRFSIEVSAEFMAWCDRKAVNGCDMTGVAYDPESHGSGGAGDGQLHAGVANEHVAIFSLKFHGDDGLRKRCERLGIDMGRNPNTLLLREKIYRYYKAANGPLGGEVEDADAGVTAANAVTEVNGAQQRLAAVPDKVNTVVRVLNDFLFEEIIPLLLLLRLMRVREKDDCCADVLPHGCSTCEGGRCTCSARHPWFVMSKAMMQNVFLRRMPNYQRSMILFVYFVVLVSTHASDRFANLVYRHIRTALALSKTGHSHKCQPGDLHQEGSNVAVVKNAACRNPASFVMAKARALVASFVVLEKQRQRNEEPDTPSEPTAGATQKEQRYHDQFNSMVKVSLTIVSEALAANGTETVAGLDLQNRSRLWLRTAIAKEHCRQASMITIAGLKDKISYILRNPTHGPLGTLHVPRPVRRGQTQAEVEAVQARRDQHEQLEALINATDTVPCQQANGTDMFWPPGANLGGGKSHASEALLSSFAKFSVADAHGVHRNAVNIFKDSSYLQQFFLDSNGDLSTEPTDRSIVIVDVLQYLVVHPKFRRGRGGTLVELARAIILVILRLYPDIQAALPQAMLMFVMDSAEFMTHLRQLQRKKRKKELGGMHGVDAATYATRPADTPLDALGSYRDLMKSGEFRGRLMAQIMHELTNANSDEGWALPAEHTGLTFVLIGGGNEVCVSHRGDPSAVPFTKNATVTTAQLREALANVPKQAEGERMMFTAAWNLLALADKVEQDLNVTRCAGFKILFDSYDTDASVGHAASFVINVGWEARRCSSSTWPGRLYLRVHPKSPEMMAMLGATAGAESMTSLREECGPVAASLGRPDGILMEVMIDLEVMVEGMKADATAPFDQDTVQRALMWPAIYSVTENDYLAAMKGGMGFAAVLTAARGDRFRSAMSACAGLGLVKITRSSEEPFVGATFELDVEAVALLIVATISHRPRTWKVLKARYVGEDLQLLNLPYETVRAASVLAREGVAAPPELALWCRLSMASHVFDQLSSWAFKANPRPHSAEEELRGSSYVCTGDGAVDLWYRLHGAPRPSAAAKLTPDAMRESLRPQFGAMVDLDTTRADWPLASVLETLSAAAKNGGAAPRPMVSKARVLPNYAKTSFEDFQTSFLGSLDSLSTARSIVERTLVLVADFNARGSGLGAPLALTATLGTLATNNGAWPAIEWPAAIDENQKLEVALKDLNVDTTRGRCTAMLLALIQHAFTCRDEVADAEVATAAAAEAEAEAEAAAAEAAALARSVAAAAEAAEAMEEDDAEGDECEPARAEPGEDDDGSGNQRRSQRRRRNIDVDG